MKNIVRVLGLSSLLVVSSWMSAQVPEPGRFTLNHAEVGIFGDYFRFSPGSSTTNFVGLGARAAFNVHPNIAVEAQMSYDFDRN